jgi:hypothetical protein
MNGNIYIYKSRFCVCNEYIYIYIYITGWLKRFHAADGGNQQQITYNNSHAWAVVPAREEDSSLGL